MILSVHQPQYIPWLGYFDKIDKSDCFVFLDQVQYKPREYQNRNRIRTKNGWLWLTVPVISKDLGRQEICDVKVNNDTNWQKKHWESLKSCYNKAPFFKEYYRFFESVYSAKWEQLIELNIHIIKYLLKELNIEIPLYYESEIGTDYQDYNHLPYHQLYTHRVSPFLPNMSAIDLLFNEGRRSMNILRGEFGYTGKTFAGTHSSLIRI